jgi:hypothetical protein
LHLAFNYLEGHIPDSFSELSSLLDLQLQGNLLTGQIPRSMFAVNFVNSVPVLPMPNLHTLELSHNLLTGPVPESVASLEWLMIFHLQSNFLTGTVPFFISNHWLYHVSMKHNFLTGILPDGFASDCLALESLDLSDNFLSGQLMPSLPPRLKLFDLSANHFTGSVPSWKVDQCCVRTLDLQNNLLYSSVPFVLNLENFSSVDLSSNVFGSVAASSQIQILSAPGTIPMLDTRGAIDGFGCPFPLFSDSSLVWLKDGCETDLTLIWILLGVSGICAAVGIALLRFNPSWTQSTRNKVRVSTEHTGDTRSTADTGSIGETGPSDTGVKTVLAVSGWILVVADVTMDLISCQHMLSFMDAYRFSSEACHSFEYSYSVLPEIESFEVYTGHNFTVYMDFLNHFLDTHYPQQFAAEFVEVAVQDFRNLCASGPGCEFVSVENDYTCQLDASYQFSPVFNICVYVMLVTILCKEAIKVGVVMYCGFRDEDTFRRLLKSDSDGDRGRNSWLRPACYTSLALPLLLARPQILKQVIFHDFSPAEEGVKFFLEGCLENIPQFIVNIFYLTSVTAVGISSAQLLSLYFGAVSLLQQMHIGYTALRVSKPSFEGNNNPDPCGGVELQSAGYFNTSTLVS